MPQAMARYSLYPVQLEAGIKSEDMQIARRMRVDSDKRALSSHKGPGWAQRNCKKGVQPPRCVTPAESGTDIESTLKSLDCVCEDLH
jgi:hypothetical protein